MKCHRVRVLVLLLVAASPLMAACGAQNSSAGTGSTGAGSSASGSSPAGSDGSAGPAGSAGSGSSAAASMSPVTSGTAYTFALPSDVQFSSDSVRTTTDGAVERRWRHAVRPTGPFCTVVAVEQPHFTQRFPESVLAVFEATNQGGDHVVRNAAVPPVTGAVGGVDQESTFTAKLDDGTTTPARLFQRQYLTSGRTLVSVSAAGPQDQVEACRLATIVNSLELTGRELATAPANS